MRVKQGSEEQLLSVRLPENAFVEPHIDIVKHKLYQCRPTQSMESLISVMSLKVEACLWFQIDFRIGSFTRFGVEISRGRVECPGFSASYVWEGPPQNHRCRGRTMVRLRLDA